MAASSVFLVRLVTCAAQTGPHIIFIKYAHKISIVAVDVRRGVSCVCIQRVRVHVRVKRASRILCLSLCVCVVTGLGALHIFLIEYIFSNRLITLKFIFKKTKKAKKKRTLLTVSVCVWCAGS